MSDKEYLAYLNKQIEQARNECDHYAKCGLLTPEWAVDELYRLTDARDVLLRDMRKLKE